MRTNLKTLIETELQDINKLHYNKSTPVAIKKITEQKREALLQYKEILNKISNEDFDRSINFANILDKLYDELSFLNDKAKELEERTKARQSKEYVATINKN